MKPRKYLPTLSELIDRLSIVQLKEVFISEHKDEYAQEIADIVHDIQAHILEISGVITKYLFLISLAASIKEYKAVSLKYMSGHTEI